MNVSLPQDLSIATISFWPLDINNKFQNFFAENSYNHLIFQKEFMNPVVTECATKVDGLEFCSIHMR